METGPQPLDNAHRQDILEAVQNARSIDGILLDTRHIEVPEDLQYGLTVRSIRITPAEDVDATICVVEKYTSRSIAYDIKSYIVFGDVERPLRYCEALIPRSEESLHVEHELDVVIAAWYQTLKKADEAGVVDLIAELERLHEMLSRKQVIYSETQALQAQLDTADTEQDEAELKGYIKQKYWDAVQVDEVVGSPKVDFKKGLLLAEEYMLRYEDFQRRVDASNRLRGVAANEARERGLYHQRLLESGQGFDLSHKEASELITILDKCARY